MRPTDEGAAVAGTTEEAARRLRRLRRGLTVAALVAIAIVGCRAAVPRGRVDVSVNGTMLSCDVAATEAGREQGLQGRPRLVAGRGMLLVNDAPGPVSVVMKDLDYPIDVAIVDSDMRVVKAGSLDPENARDLSTAEPALYVLETSEGWLESNGVGVGSTLDFPGRRPGF
jgi:uncharacterized membrane protein (UPF0127 family)